jgi:hypothetical protein
MVQHRQLAARGNECPRTTERLPLYVIMAALLLMVIGQPQGWSRAEEASPEETSNVYLQDLQLVASTNSVTDFSPRPMLRVAPNGTMMTAFNKVVDVSQGIQKPYYSVYNRASRSWSDAQPLYNGANSQRYVTFAFDSASRAHAVWLEGYNVYYARQDGWPGSARKLSTSTDKILDPPAIAIGANGVVHVVWAQGNNEATVYHVYSNTSGGSWSTPPAPISLAGHGTSTPSVAVTADGNVHVVWSEATFDSSLPSFYRDEIFYKKGTVQGSSFSWTTPQKVSGSLTAAVRPAIIAAGNELHLGFTRVDAPATQYAYYVRFVNGSWSTPLNANAPNPVGVNTSSPYFLITNLTVCGGNVYLLFHGAQFGETSEQVWSASSNNGWQGAVAITARGTRHIDPTVACDSGNVAVALDRVTIDNNAHDIYWGSEEQRVLLPLVLGR